MTFLGSKLLLGWLVAAGLPLLIYWLYRRRRTIVEWSANYVLRLTLQREGKKSIWRLVVILSLRTLAIVLLVLALARPLWPRTPDPNALPHGPGSLHQVVLVDNSRSMSIGYRSFTRDDEMRSRLEALLARTRHGDQCEMILLATPEGTKLAPLRIPCPATPARIGEILREIRLLERPAAILDGLQLAAERFHVTSVNNRQLVLLGDLSRKDMPDADNLRNLRREFERLKARVVFYEIRDRDRPNLAVQDCRVGATTLFSGWRYHVFIPLRNYGSDPVQSTVSVGIRQGDRVIDTQTLPLDMKADESKLFDFPLRAPNGTDGAITLRARVTDESYQFDNARELDLNLRSRARLLLVYHPAEDEIAKPLWRDSRYLELTLKAVTRGPTEDSGPAKHGNAAHLDIKTGAWVSDPAGGGKDAKPEERPAIQWDIERVKADDLSPEKIAGADAVVLCSVSRIEPPARDALLRFVQRGGGVLFGMGDTVLPDEFNECFGGLSPAPLAEAYVGAQRDRPDWEYDAPHKQIEKTFDHPLLRRYLDEAEGSIENVRVYNYFRVRGETNALMSLSNGDPLLMERSVGRGKTLLLTSTLGGMWNTLPVRNMYVNLVYAWLTYLTSFRTFDRNLAVGDPLIVESAQTNLMVAAADGPAAGPLARRVVDGRSYIRYDGLSAPGDYRVFSPTGDVSRFRVQEELVESDTRALSPAERTAFAQDAGGTVAAAWPEVAASLGVGERSGFELLGVLVLAMMAGLLLDAVLTRIWFR